MSQRVSNCSY